MTNNTTWCYNINKRPVDLFLTIGAYGFVHRIRSRRLIFILNGVIMEKVLIEAIVDSKQVKTLKIMSIIYLILVFPLGILLLIKGCSLGNQKIEVTKDNIKLTYKKLGKKSAVLPLNTISGVEYLAKTKGLNIFSGSQQIRFEAITNAEEVAKVVSGLIAKNSNNTSAPSGNSADELLKYKKLLDSGVISQEEFDAKKKQLLDI